MVYTGQGKPGKSGNWKLVRESQGIRVRGQGKFLSEDIKNILLFISHSCSFMISNFSLALALEQKLVTKHSRSKSVSKVCLKMNVILKITIGGIFLICICEKYNIWKLPIASFWFQIEYAGGCKNAFKGDIFCANFPPNSQKFYNFLRGQILHFSRHILGLVICSSVLKLCQKAKMGNWHFHKL